MPAPFYNAIKGTTAGTPGTGAFTPNAASSGSRAWSNVPAGWMGLVLYEDGSNWELCYSYWNGTTLSRAATQLFDSSTGSALTLTSAATAALIPDANELMFHLGGVPWRFVNPVPGGTGVDGIGTGTRTTTGTLSAQSLATTNFLTEQPRTRLATATTPANVQAGWSFAAAFYVYSTAAGRGGGEQVGRFGASQLPTGPRLFMGMTSVTIIANTGEPSALVASIAAFAKDSTDTNIQLLTNDNSGGGNKTDTGIAWVANGWYEYSVWFEPGGGRVYGLLMRLDTGAIWFGSTTTQLPANGALLLAHETAGLSATTGTALNLELGTFMMRGGS